MSSIEKEIALQEIQQVKKSKFSRYCLCLAFFLPITILVIMLFIGALVFTNSGLKLALWGVEKAIPALQIENAEGSLIPAFTLSGIHYRNDELLKIDANKLHFSFTAKCLLEPSLCINDITINGLRLDLPKIPKSTEKPKEAPVEQKLLSIPIPINIDSININDLDINILGNKVRWKSFNTGLRLYQSDLTLTPLSWETITVELAQSEKEGKKVEPHANQTSSVIELPSIYIPLNISVEKFSLSDFTLKQETPVIINQLNFTATAKEYDVGVTDFYLDIPEANINLDTKITLTDDYPLFIDALFKVKKTELKGHNLKLNATGSVADLKASLQLSGGLKAYIKAHVQPLKKELPFDIQLSKGKLYWPLQGKKEVTTQLILLNVKGDLNRYHFSTKANVEGVDIPTTKIDLKGKGSLEEIELSKLLVNTLGGTVSGTAGASWASLVDWKADIRLQNIQPGLQWSEAEGNVSGELSTTGYLTQQGGWIVELPKVDINGIFREYPLDIKGALKAQDVNGSGMVNLNIPQLALQHGNNGIAVSGALDKEWDLNIDVNFPELSDSVPNLYGKLTGRVELEGKFAEPTINLNLDALGLEWQKEVKLEKASIKGYVSPIPEIDANLKIELLNGQYQKQVLHKLLVKFYGEEKEHQLHIDLDTDTIDSHLVFKGALDRTTSWIGELSEADVITDIGPWKLNKQAELSYNIQTQQAFIQAHCWSQEDGASVCLNKDLTAGKEGAVDLSIKQFQFQKLAAFLPEETQIYGEINVDVFADWFENSSPHVKASIILPKGKIEQIMEDTITVGWDEITVNAEMKNDQLTSNWAVMLTNNGQLKGEMNIDQLTGKKTLTGFSEIEQLSLSMLKPLLGEYSELDALIKSRINISGPIEHPKMLGAITIDNIKMKGDVSPVDINQGNINIQFSGYDAVLTSLITTPDGELNIDGTGEWSNLDNWKVGLDVSGQELPVNVPPMVKLKVKPDLQIRIIPTLAKISGSIGIPWGRIVVKNLPESAIGVSSDEVLLTDNLKPIDTTTPLPMRVETDIIISIGDDVLLSAFGLEGGLIGKLNITQKDKAPFINGEVNIKEGTYRSFGQDLQIQKGKILFNGPADQPYVAIEAIRNPENTRDDVIAGIRVNGSADTPTVEIFSSPSMPQANALSYLLRGQDIDAESGGNAMTTTLIGLSIAKSGKIVGEIGQAFGVQDLQLDTAGSGEESQVTISGYIAPGLQVKYGVGIFNSVGEFTLRYRMMSNFYIEVISSLESAVDIIYQFEFD